MIKFLKNEHGVSIAEVMIALALTAGLSAVLMNLAETQSKQNKTAVINSEAIEVFTALNSMIANKDSCEATFMGLPKGTDVSEFRYSFDPNKEPYATVGQKFRNYKLDFTGFRILKDDEAAARGLKVETKDPTTGRTVVAVELTLARPKGVIGGQNIRKYVEFQVTMGKGLIVSSKTQDAVIEACYEKTTNDGCIANFDTGICNADPSKWPDDMEGSDEAQLWVGYCIDLSPPTPQEDVIIQCLTAK